MTRTAAGALIVMLLAAFAADAQESKPAFEVASVRENVSGAGGFSAGVRPGGFYAVTNLPLVEIVGFAYGILAAQIVDGPDWIRTSRFDIAAKASGDVPAERVPLMVQSLLEERFGLRVRHERREMPLLHLVLARSGGRVGPNLRPCTSSGDDSGPTVTTERFEVPPRSTSSIHGACAPVSSLAGVASQRLQAIVVDRTGLGGEWRYRLGFGPDLPPAGATLAPPFPVALREQLGLRLERARGMVDVLVVESVERPTEN